MNSLTESEQVLLGNLNNCLALSQKDLTLENLGAVYEAYLDIHYAGLDTLLKLLQDVKPAKQWLDVNRELLYQWNDKERSNQNL